LLKRLFDVVVASAGLVLLSPLVLLIAIAVKVTSRGPVFFRQERAGLHGVPFCIYKFRTMRWTGLGHGCLITVGGDGRITPMGRLLRRTKLDELPQLINVVRGEMSLVGPRPEIRAYVDLFPRQYARVLSVRPGITHRAALEFYAEEQLLASVRDPERYYVEQIMPRKLQLYLRDIERTSLMDDIRTILETVGSVARSLSASHGGPPPVPAASLPAEFRPKPALSRGRVARGEELEAAEVESASVS
jgi:lipopolysaccharide/colanic/teichoic acid biosynthesis glycosyltransferase